MERREEKKANHFFNYFFQGVILARDGEKLPGGRTARENRKRRCMAFLGFGERRQWEGELSDTTERAWEGGGEGER